MIGVCVKLFLYNVCLAVLALANKRRRAHYISSSKEPRAGPQKPDEVHRSVYRSKTGKILSIRVTDGDNIVPPQIIRSDRFPEKYRLTILFDLDVASTFVVLANRTSRISSLP